MAFLHLHSQDVDLLYIFYEEINFTPPFYYPTLKSQLLTHSVAIDSEEEAFKRKQVAKVIVKNSNDNDASDDNSIMDI